MIPRVLFVGSFKSKAKDGSLGGQMFACGTLIDSEISNEVEWVLIDSTADSNVDIPLWKKLWKASRRFLSYTKCLLFSRIKLVLIFCGDGTSFLEKGTMARMAKMMGKKVLFAPRSGFILRDVETSTFMKRFVPKVIQRVDFVICQSQFWRSFYSKFDDDPGKFVVIQNWLDLTQYQPLQPESDNKIHVLFMSWVDKNKGIFELVKAAGQISTDQVCFDIAGKGEAFDEVLKMVEETGVENRFIFHGWVRGDKKTELINKSHLYVLPSHFEGFPNSLLEAMASGKAVVSTDVGSVSDLVTHGENGLIFQKGSVEELVECLTLLINDRPLREKVAKNARTTVEQNNNVEQAVDSFRNLIRKCVA